jgi:cyanuric acid amidohydrolase
MTMECLVYRVAMRDPGDASGITGLLDAGTLAAGEIVAILGKTEGNGCVNDFTRGYAMTTLSAALAPRLGIAADAVPGRVAMVMSGGTEGGLSPHFLVFAVRAGGAAQPGRKSLAIGTARTGTLRPEQIGRPSRWPRRSVPQWHRPPLATRPTFTGSRSNARF